MLPLVLFLDIDGTLIGDVLPQVCEWEVLSRFDAAKLPAFKKHLIEALKAGLLRPNVSDFITSLRARYEHIEFFIYTASDMTWANFLIPCIEQIIGFKFNRPLFSRKHCESNKKKSISKVLPSVVRSLKGTYSGVTVKSLKNRVAIVDNNNVMVDGESHRCIKCPTYNFAYLYDVLARIDVLKLIKNYQEIISILQRYELYLSTLIPTSFNSFKARYYKYLAKRVQYYNAFGQKVFAQDRLWVHLMNVLSKMQLEDLRSPIIEKINTDIMNVNAYIKLRKKKSKTTKK